MTTRALRGRRPRRGLGPAALLAALACFVPHAAGSAQDPASQDPVLTEAPDAPPTPQSALSSAVYTASRPAGTGRALVIPPHAVAGFHQRVRPLPTGGVEVTVVVSDLPRPPSSRNWAPLLDDVALGLPDGEGLDEAAEAALSRRAAELARPDLPAEATVEAIVSWVGSSIQHVDAPEHGDSAADALASGEGSCVGRSRLAAALLRRAGVPARTVHGLVVPPETRGGHPLGSSTFVLHRWLEARLPGVGWVPSDPGESIHLVDARHLFLALEGPAYDVEAQRDLVIVPVRTASRLAVETRETGAHVIIRPIPRAATAGRAVGATRP